MTRGSDGVSAPAVLQTGPIAVNTYIIPLAGESVLVVDPAASSLSGDERAIADYLKAHGQRPAGIFLTHGHFDHILGIPPLLKAFGSEGEGIAVFVSGADAAAIKDETLAFHSPSLEMMGDDGSGRLAKALQEVIAAVAALAREVADAKEAAAAFSGGKYRLIATPGHTAGSVCLYNEADGILFSGDTMFYHGWGRTDLGGNEAAIMQSIKALQRTLPPQTKVYPGHDRYGFAMSENF